MLLLLAGVKRRRGVEYMMKKQDKFAAIVGGSSAGGSIALWVLSLLGFDTFKYVAPVLLLGVVLLLGCVYTAVRKTH